MTRTLAMKLRHNIISVLMAGAAGLAMAGPSAAQTYGSYEADGLVVYGNSRDAQQLSTVVSFRDLDLRHDGDVKELWRRINWTADSLCTQLGEEGRISVSGSVLPSCYDAAIARVKWDVRKAVDNARRWG